MPNHGFLFYGQTIHQPSVLLHGNGLYLGFITGPAEFTIGKPLVQKKESVTFIKKSLNPVGSSSAEEENAAFVGRIQIEFIPYNCGKPINAPA